MKKEIVLIVLLLACIKSISAQQVVSLPPNQLILSDKNVYIPFVWHGDTIDSQWNPYAALLVPVKLPSCPKLFYMQLDLGSPYSLFYKEKLADVANNYSDAVRITDSTDKLSNFKFSVDKLNIKAKEIRVKPYTSPPIDWKDKNGVEVIGTLGADFIENKIMLINYPNKQLFVGEAIPNPISPTLKFLDFIFAQRRVLLPAVIKGEQTVLYFDTGSSAFELLTDKETCKRLSDRNSLVSQYKVNSWGKSLIANSIISNDSIEIGNQIIPIRRVTYMEGVSEKQVIQMSKLGIGGMIGNKLFLDYIIIIDTKHKKFALTQ